MTAISSKRPLIIGIGGFTSEVGKTTLLCELLRAFPAWEAIKCTRGHYRSCGKDPEACCVSHLLGDEPVVRSGRDATYALAKDTGRYWDAGATNVHWVIATDSQIEKGTQVALSRVKAKGVFIEGNSFTRFFVPDYFIMVARRDHLKIKTTAQQALAGVSAFYVSGDTGDQKDQRFFEGAKWAEKTRDTPIFTASDFDKLVWAMRKKIRPEQEIFRQTLRAERAS